MISEIRLPVYTPGPDQVTNYDYMIWLQPLLLFNEMKWLKQTITFSSEKHFDINSKYQEYLSKSAIPQSLRPDQVKSKCWNVVWNTLNLPFWVLSFLEYFNLCNYFQTDCEVSVSTCHSCDVRHVSRVRVNPAPGLQGLMSPLASSDAPVPQCPDHAVTDVL